MKQIRYICSHCGRKFEAEEKEIVECPGCYWTSSVKREDDVLEAGIKPAAAGVPSKSAFSLQLPKLPWKQLGIGALLIIGVFLFVSIVLPAASKLTRNAKGIKIFPERKEKTAKQIPAEKLQETSSPELAGVSVEEQNILKRRIHLAADRAPSDEEQKILSSRAVFKSGFSEKLPSQAWTLQNFKDMVAQQEKFYQVPLPHSYKSKLEDLFKTKYVAGAEAFKSGDLIQARNNWVEALAFPIYANNPAKHRGVVLTMLRPFISDTLSKIGAINGSMVEKGVREKEQAVAEAYEKLLALIDQKSWPEAVAAINVLNQKLDAFANPTSLAAGPSAYPKGISLVDRDIQATLNGLLNVPPPAISDLEPMRVDAARKRRVMEGFMPEKLQARQQKYDEGMDAVQRGDWAGAEKAFKEVDLPTELSQDAAEKLRILKKMQNKNFAEVPKDPKKQRRDERDQQ